MKFKKLFTLLFIAIIPVMINAQNMDSVQGDFEALQALYNSTDGENWNTEKTFLAGTDFEFTNTGNNTGWSDMTPETMGDAYGVHVNTEGRVIALTLNGTESWGTGSDGEGELGGNNLEGTLPPEIGNLTKLEYFSIKQNFLTGEIPWASLNNMVSLRHLHLNGGTRNPDPNTDLHPGKGTSVQSNTNVFTGEITNSLLNLTELEWLEMTGPGGINLTGLSGEFPADFLKNSSKLKSFFVHSSAFTRLPESLGDFEQLIHLSVSRMPIDELPFSFEKLTELRYFKFSAHTRSDRDRLGIPDAYMTGDIPDMSNCTKLRLITFTNNGLNGEIPDYFFDGRMPWLGAFILDWNNLTGHLPEIPPSVDEHGNRNHRVRVFGVNGSNLTGEIPASYATNFEKDANILEFGWNDFSGELPQQGWSTYRSLRILRFSGNNLSGNIPSELPNARDLFFTNNNFTGFDGQAALDLAQEHGRLKILYIGGNSIPASDIDPYITDLVNEGVDFRYGDQDADSSDSGDDEVLNAPDPASPQDGAEDVPLMFTVEWSPVADADEYILHIDRAGEDGSYEYFYSDNEEVTITDPNYTISEESLSGTVHGWRVRGVKNGVKGEWSPIWQFTTVSEPVSPPSVPVLDSPEDGQAGVPVRPALSWSESTEAETYTVQVSTDGSTFDPLIKEELDITESSIDLEELDYSTAYYWRVKAVNSAGESEWSDVWNFTTRDAPTAPPAVPNLSSPEDEEADVSVSPVFTWTSAEEAEMYTLQVSETSDFTESTEETNEITETWVRLDDLAYSATYWWRVKAVNSMGESSWSGAKSFTTREEPVSPPAVPELVGPENEEQDVPTNPIFTWSSSEDAESYTLQVSESETFSSTEAEESDIRETWFQVENLEESARYYWRVRAANSAGESRWSESRSFNTISGGENNEDQNEEMETSLSQNYPNPFNPSTVIRFTIDNSQQISLKVYNMAGRLVSTIYQGTLEAGVHEETFRAQNLSSGIYFYRLITENEVITRKMTLMK